MQNLLKAMLKKALKNELKDYKEWFGKELRGTERQIKVLNNNSSLSQLLEYNLRQGNPLKFKSDALNDYAWAIYWIKMFIKDLRKK